METRAIAPSVLLLALLAGCGGATSEASAPDPAAGIEEGEATTSRAPATPSAPQRRIDESLIPPPGQPIVRETYSYAGGPRDPFVSVLDLSNAGPEFADLELVALYYIAGAPSTSVAVLRDRLTGKKYTVREGDRLGRMRIASILPKDVAFTIDDYGTERQETLSIRKPEGNSP